MASLRDIKRRIKSVRNTSQITKAMQMVASAKMRRAQELALKGRTYMSALANVLKHLQDTLTEGISSPLMEMREKGKKLIIVVSTDRGLCARRRYVAGAETKQAPFPVPVAFPGAGDGTRTREYQLGKLGPYHLAMPARVEILS